MNTIKNKGGRPRKPQSEKLIKHSYSLAPDAAKAFRKLCKKQNKSMSIYIQELIAREIELWSADHDNK